MSEIELKLPLRHQKPRNNGITILIDNGVPLHFFEDSIAGSADLIDFVKFGWGTSVISKHLEKKMECLQEHQVDYFFGGTLFEKFLHQGKVDQFYQYCKKYHCKYIEISNGTIELSNREKAAYISDFSREFHVFSEVGTKDSQKALLQNSMEWIEYIQEDLEAGSRKVITEARETGTSGICNDRGDMRGELIDDIVSSGIEVENIVFEAPNKKMQTYFIHKFGSNVNLANIPFSDPISLETLRLGLRSDTFFLFEERVFNR